MINVLFYGNCQTYAVLRTLNLNKNKYCVNHVECWTSNIDKQKFTEMIQTCDIIITQPINDNYRDVDYLSTSYIIANKSEKCKVFIFDSCYFDFYYFDLTYKTFNNEMLAIPGHYHYHKMLC